jgi:hypothetical protein
MSPFDKLVNISRQLDKMNKVDKMGQPTKKWPDYNRSQIRSVKLGLVGMSHDDEGVWGLSNKSTELSKKTRWKIAFNGTNPSGVKPVLYLYSNIEKPPIANLTGRKIAEYLNGVK